jgi:hypothetical protein
MDPATLREDIETTLFIQCVESEGVRVSTSDGTDGIGILKLINPNGGRAVRMPDNEEWMTRDHVFSVCADLGLSGLAERLLFQPQPTSKERPEQSSGASSESASSNQ